jgi:hypothetical protein
VNSFRHTAQKAQQGNDIPPREIHFVTHPHHRWTQEFDWLLSGVDPTPRFIYGDEATLAHYLPSLKKHPPQIMIIFQLEQLAYWASCFCPVLVFPMNDYTRNTPDSYLAACHQVEWISFCRALHHRLAGLGLSSRYLQYAPDPKNFPTVNWEQSPRAFFWERMPGELDQHAVKELLGSLGPVSLEVRSLADSQFAQTPGKAEVIGSVQWRSREEYLDKLCHYNIFVAPRRHEGLGMTVLEAMAMGMCVVAEDQPTANEYILPLLNGLLFRGSEEKIHPLAPVAASRLAEMGAEARRRIGKIHQSWNVEKGKIGQTVDELMTRSWQHREPPWGLLEATMDFKRRPELLWKLCADLNSSPKIWRSRSLETRSRLRAAWKGRLQWFLKNPRACLRHWLQKPAL